LPTSFVGAEGKNVGRRTSKLGVEDGHAGTDIRVRPEVIEPTTIVSFTYLLTYLFDEIISEVIEAHFNRSG